MTVAIEFQNGDTVIMCLSCADVWLCGHEHGRKLGKQPPFPFMVREGTYEEKKCEICR